MRVCCVSCGLLLPKLFQKYQGGALRLTRCPECLLVADKYIEWDETLVALDIALLRLPAFRHLLCNRWPAQPFDARHLACLACTSVAIDVLLSRPLGCPSWFPVAAFVSEHALAAVGISFLCSWRYKSWRRIGLKRSIYAIRPSRTLLCTCMVMPQALKVLAAMITIWDAQASAILAVSFLMRTMQFAALYSVTDGRMAIVGVAFALTGKSALMLLLSTRAGAASQVPGFV
jgi:hypothetical protein